MDKTLQALSVANLELERSCGGAKKLVAAVQKLPVRVLVQQAEGQHLESGSGGGREDVRESAGDSQSVGSPAAAGGMGGADASCSGKAAGGTGDGRTRDSTSGRSGVVARSVAATAPTAPAPTPRGDAGAGRAPSGRLGSKRLRLAPKRNNKKPRRGPRTFPKAQPAQTFWGRGRAGTGRRREASGGRRARLCREGVRTGFLFQAWHVDAAAFDGP